ncbi:phosphorylcholine transferase LicD [Ruminococcus sp. 5_1_39BFAA]|uniref:LicD family protein n=1 Tax=Ruminococcus sp. 5_1_39BFAA TaxID=457412 RepID=UPI0035650A48
MKLSTVSTFKKMNTDDERYIHLEGELLRKYQHSLIGIAQDVINVCEEENITYHLTGGSALGAVRHHGFIPWDDDMDIDMLGSDFDRFERAFLKKFGDKYWVHSYKTVGYGMTVNRVRLKNSVFRGREDINNQECGFFIDVLRIENTYNNKVLRTLHGVLCMGMGLLLSCRNFYDNRMLMLELANDNPQVKRVFKFKISLGRLVSFLPVNTWTRLTQACYGLCKNNNSEYVTVPAGRNHFFGEMYKRKDFVETAEMEFEGHIWKVPKCYDAYLIHMYGNYMKIPEEKDREVHVLLELKFPEDIKSEAKVND